MDQLSDGEKGHFREFAAHTFIPTPSYGTSHQFGFPVADTFIFKIKTFDSSPLPPQFISVMASSCDRNISFKAYCYRRICWAFPLTY